MKPYFQNELVTLYHADALALGGVLPNGTADMVLTDPPYGTTNCDWDIAIDPRGLMGFIKGLVKKNGAAVMFSQNPYAAKTICADVKFFRYEWVWSKNLVSGFLNAYKMPMRSHELILVFYKSLPKFNPIKTVKPSYGVRRPSKKSSIFSKCGWEQQFHTSDGKRFPIDVLRMDRKNSERLHPTSKPVALCEYMVKTYTNENELVVDPFCGGGTTGVACMNLKRRCILVEKDERFCEVSAKRLTSLSIGDHS